MTWLQPPSRHRSIKQMQRFVPQPYFFFRDLNFDILICACRYVCLGGSSSPTPSDGSHGYPCPKGHRCPVGSTQEVPCEPGTYSPALGAAFCRTCPRGTLCASTATQEPSICPAGEYGGNIQLPPEEKKKKHNPKRTYNERALFSWGYLCPAGTVLPQPCPLGTFSNQTGAHSFSVCMPCPSGRYCGSLGSSIPQGN